MADLTSIIDVPLQMDESSGESYLMEDSLEIGSYAAALTSVIVNADTPLTIGIQGEWGSGKTSMLNQIQNNLFSIKKSHYGIEITGSDIYHIIWINSWEHSLMRSPEMALISIISEIIDNITKADGQLEAGQKAKHYLAEIAKGAMKIGAAASLGAAGASVVGDMLLTKENSISKLRETLQNSANTIIERKENKIERFIVFVDDLDRIDPENAVAILELLKNIFSIKHCLFVLAIDYQVVVKGLKGKFGEPNEQNEWEFRAFFDKIIQLPFMMPVGSYNIQSYLENMLIATGYLSKREVKDLDMLADIIKYSIGANPRSLKRLVNSLTLIICHRAIIEGKASKANNVTSLIAPTSIKGIFLCLVCIQIAFPKVFELLVAKPDFSEWDDSMLPPEMSNPEQEKELINTLSYYSSIHEDDFDEDWEQILFKMVWVNGWQKKRIVDISRLFSIIKDDLIGVHNKINFDEIMKYGLKHTSVTSSVMTNDSALTTTGNDTGSSKREIKQFWLGLKQKLKDESMISNEIKPGFSGYLVKSISPAYDEINYEISYRLGVFIRIRVNFPSDNSYEIMDCLSCNKKQIEQVISPHKLWVNINTDGGKQELRVVLSEPTLPKRGTIFKCDVKLQKKYIKYLSEVLPKLETIVEKLINEYLNHPDPLMLSDEGKPVKEVLTSEINPQ